MANINHLEMAEDFAALNQVEIKKAFFGLSTSIIYKPTHSKIRIVQNEYDAYNGKLLEELLLTSQEKLSEESDANKKGIKKSSIGNIRLDACISDDKQFVAAQLLQFVDFDYAKMTDLKVFEGKAAEAVAASILAS